MEAEIPQRIDQFLELLAMWTIEMFHIEGRPMEFGEQCPNGRPEKPEVDSMQQISRHFEHRANT